MNELINRYNLNELKEEPMAILHQIGHSQKFYLQNKEVDLNRVATLVLQDIRHLALGKITFDLFEDFNE